MTVKISRVYQVTFLAADVDVEHSTMEQDIEFAERLHPMVAQLVPGYLGIVLYSDPVEFGLFVDNHKDATILARLMTTIGKTLIQEDSQHTLDREALLQKLVDAAKPLADELRNTHF